ncbi:hypothetical protein HFX_5085 (plasmid) [Haloferax mediterranei ATCC 33500]|uniref:Uncharacterized protein n=1 Tax=Haloferax mediterranei (strain ATCC 33500 / DSM 1411 / JCM 8866 / NBRC 14739 / NCIMB 2177 / R-4) TaxID=523841 RepID=I3R9L1_HALMT|nr:hypothetical protein HFX_5085 [Haloferax mediterranei ATCC 33500]
MDTAFDDVGHLGRVAERVGIGVRRNVRLSVLLGEFVFDGRVVGHVDDGGPPPSSLVVEVVGKQPHTERVEPRRVVVAVRRVVAVEHLPIRTEMFADDHPTAVVLLAAGEVDWLWDWFVGRLVSAETAGYPDKSACPDCAEKSPSSPFALRILVVILIHIFIDSVAESVE